MGMHPALPSAHKALLRPCISPSLQHLHTGRGTTTQCRLQHAHLPPKRTSLPRDRPPCRASHPSGTPPTQERRQHESGRERQGPPHPPHHPAAPNCVRRCNVPPPEPRAPRLPALLRIARKRVAWRQAAHGPHGSQGHGPLLRVLGHMHTCGFRRCGIPPCFTAAGYWTTRHAGSEGRPHCTAAARRA